jgi:hypothetical protein
MREGQNLHASKQHLKSLNSIHLSEKNRGIIYCVPIYRPFARPSPSFAINQLAVDEKVCEKENNRRTFFDT